MEALKIRGNALLSGTIDISGSKNATLPILAATILAAGKSRLRRVHVEEFQTSQMYVNYNASWLT